MKDEGGPLGIGVQAQISNRFKLLRRSAVVVSVEAKAQGKALSRCASGRRTKVNLPKTRR
jgi:hypothetical protein